MAAGRFLDEAGLKELWTKCKAWFGHALSLGDVGNDTVDVKLTSTSGTYASSKATLPAATATKAGVMSAADKARLDGMADGANKTVVDAELSATSTNPVQNKAVQAALAGKQATLTSAQQSAADSGITAAKVTKYDNMVAAGGEPNTIETVKVNGTALTPDASKAVDVTVPAAANDATITVTAFDGTTTTFTTNQGTAATVGKGMTNAQRNAIDSGINDTKVNKLDSVEFGANKYTLPAATTTALGGIKSAASVKNVDNTLDTGYIDVPIVVDKDGNAKASIMQANNTQGGVISSYQLEEFEGKQDALSDAQIAATNSGLTSADKAKLDGIESGANKYVLPIAGSETLGGVKAGSNVSIDSNGYISAYGANNGTITVTAFDGTTTTFTTDQASAKTVGKGMTDAQLAAINSGVKAADVAKLNATGNDALVTYGGMTSSLGQLSSDLGKSISNLGTKHDNDLQDLDAQLTKTMDDKIAAAEVGAAMFQGTIAKQADIANGYKKGYYWVVGTAGTYVGQACEAGDMVFAVKDATSDTAVTDSDFSIVQSNIVAMTTAEVDAVCA